MQYIYQILLPNEKSYIGITSNLKQRHSVGKDGATFKLYANQNPIMYKDILVFGRENVKVNILGTTENRDEAEELEYYWITRLETTNHLKGYNHVPSGFNRSQVMDPYYKSDEYKKDLQHSIDLIERYDGIRVSYLIECNNNNRLRRYHKNPEKVKQYMETKKLKNAGVISPGYDTSHIDIEEKKRKAFETRKHVDKVARERFLEEISK